MKLCVLASLVLIFSLSSHARASESRLHAKLLPPEAQEAAMVLATKAVTSLTESKISFKNFDPFRFVNEAKHVQFLVSGSGQLVTGGRVGHRYDVENQTVTVSPIDLETDNVFELSLILFHETLGALGYADEIYQISSPIQALAAMKARGFSDSNLKRMAAIFDFPIERRTTHQIAALKYSEGLDRINIENRFILARSGGITEGGGGGDPIAAMTKTMVILEGLMKNINTLKLRYFSAKVDIESFYEMQGRGGYVCPYNAESFGQNTFVDRTQKIIVWYVPRDCGLLPADSQHLNAMALVYDRLGIN